MIAAYRLPRLWAPAALLGLAVAVTVSLLSHSGGRNIPLLLFSDVLHVIATAAWGGGLLYFARAAALPALHSQRSGTPLLAELGRRFSVIGILGVTALFGTGIYMALNLIYAPVALTATSYGNALVQKLILVALVLGIAAANYLWFVPRMGAKAPAKRPQATDEATSGNPTAKDSSQAATQRPAFGRRFAWALGGETVLLLAILLAVGQLTTQPPPEEPTGLLDPVHQAGTVANTPYVFEIEPLPDGRLRFELELPEVAAGNASFRDIEVDLTMLDHPMPEQRVPLTEIAPGRYEGTTMLSMRGRWQAETILQTADGQASFTALLISTASSREAGGAQFVRISLERVQYLPFGYLWFLGYIGMGIFGVVLFRSSLREHDMRPFQLVAALLIAASVWQVGAMLQVQGVPTIYTRNPVATSPEVIARGRDLYQAYCLACHGVDARGQGPEAAGMVPPPADLTTSVVWHTDGELMWWIREGIRGTGMPGFGAILSEEDAWIIVHYLQSLTDERRRIR